MHARMHMCQVTERLGRLDVTLTGVAQMIIDILDHQSQDAEIISETKSSPKPESSSGDAT